MHIAFAKSSFLLSLLPPRGEKGEGGGKNRLKSGMK